MNFVITIAQRQFFPNEKRSNAISNMTPALAEILWRYDWMTHKSGVSTPDA